MHALLLPCTVHIEFGYCLPLDDLCVNDIVGPRSLEHTRVDMANFDIDLLNLLIGR